jgi:hypothetical protein
MEPLDMIGVSLKAKYIKRTGSPGKYKYIYHEGGDSASSKKPVGGEVDKEAGREVLLQIENDSDVYRQRIAPAHKNLVNKMASEKYDKERANVMFYNIITDFARSHEKDVGPINRPTRMAAAVEMRKDFETEAKYGNYDNYLTAGNKKKKEDKKK